MHTHLKIFISIYIKVYIYIYIYLHTVTNRLLWEDHIKPALFIVPACLY